MIIIYIKEDEIYKNVTYPGIKDGMYQISNWGNIRSIKKNGKYRQLRPVISSNKYYHVGLCTDIKKKYKYVCIHRLVAWEFCSGYNESESITHVNHKNSNVLENYYENLEWVTVSENMKHAFREGNKKYVYHSNNSGPRLSIRGSNNPNSKFNPELICEICELISNGFGNTYIYNNTSLHTITNFSNGNALIKRIKSRKSWIDISKDYKW